MILEQCKGVHCVDLGESFQTYIYLQNLASIQPRTSPVKFARSSQAARFPRRHLCIEPCSCRSGRSFLRGSSQLALGAHLRRLVELLAQAPVVPLQLRDLRGLCPNLLTFETGVTRNFAPNFFENLANFSDYSEIL